MPTTRNKQWRTKLTGVTVTVNQSDENTVVGADGVAVGGDEPRIEFTTVLIQIVPFADIESTTLQTSDFIFSHRGLPTGATSSPQDISILHPFIGTELICGVVVRAWENDRSRENDRKVNQQRWHGAVSTAISRSIGDNTNAIALSVRDLNDIQWINLVPSSAIETSIRDDDDLLGSNGRFFNTVVRDFSERGDETTAISESEVEVDPRFDFSFRLASSETDSIFTVNGVLEVGRADVIVRT